VAAKSYRELLAWQKSMALVRDVYRLTQGWPPSEMYGLIGQVRRAAVSVPSNIAEGQGRGPGKEFTHHLSIAYGSLLELETQLLIAKDLGYSREVDVEPVLASASEVGRLLNGLLRSVSG